MENKTKWHDVIRLRESIYGQEKIVSFLSIVSCSRIENCFPARVTWS